MIPAIQPRSHDEPPQPANADPVPVGRVGKRGVSRKFALADHQHALDPGLLKLIDDLSARVKALEAK